MLLANVIPPQKVIADRNCKDPKQKPAHEAFSEAGKVQPNEAAVHSAHHIQPANPRTTVLHNRKGSTVNAATMLGGHIRLRAAAEEGCAFPAEASA